MPAAMSSFLLFESCTMWFIGVPLAFIGALVLQWPVYLVFTLVIGRRSG